MGDIAQVKEAFLGSVKADADKSRLEFGGTEVSFHCDKFNTRVVKGLEDVVGVDDAHKLLSRQAEITHHAFLQKFLLGGRGAEAFSSLSPAEKLAAIFDIYKVLAYGAFEGNGVSEAGGKVTSKSSYVAEGWLENLERWNWTLRENPVCHDACGQIAAALAVAFGKPVETYSVTETACRAKGDDTCEFVVEVK
jgi:hypothetical protein